MANEQCLTNLIYNKIDSNSCLIASEKPPEQFKLETPINFVGNEDGDLWTNEVEEILNVPARKVRYNKYEHFSKFINAMYPDYKNILSVGCGLGEETYLLSKLGYNVTGIDSNPCSPSHNINFRRQTFTLDTDITDYDLITGLHCCDASEKIIRNCLNNDKEFVVTLCEINQGIKKKNITTRKQYVDYLKGISSKLKVTILPIYNPLTCQLWGETIYYKKKI